MAGRDCVGAGDVLIAQGGVECDCGRCLAELACLCGAAMLVEPTTLLQICRFLLLKFLER